MHFLLECCIVDSEVFLLLEIAINTV